MKLLFNPYLLLAMASLCWSGNHVIGRAIAGHVPPFAISTLRWLLPATVLVIVWREKLAMDWPAMKRAWPVMLFLGATGGALFTATQYVALQYTTALNVSVLNSLSPVLIAAAAALFFGDRLSWLQAGGIVLSLAGVLVVVARGEWSTLRQFDFNWGDVLNIFAMLLWALYSVFLRRRPNVHWASFMAVFGLISAFGALPFAIAEFVTGYRLQPTALTFWSIVYISIFPSLLAFLAWMRGVEAIGANRAGVFIHLVPLYSAVLASVLLGERLHLFHIAGFALILAGVWCAARRAASP